MMGLLKRFEAKVRRSDGCWEWLASKRPNGYGQLLVDGGRIGYAHRVAYELYVGRIPPTLCVCHRCDNRGCVNPEHLFLGTAGDNTRDAMAKGRLSGKHDHNGARNPRAKLTAQQVAVVRQSTRKGTELAKRFGVSPTAISRIRLGRSWMAT
jgi:hypothetical protein